MALNNISLQGRIPFDFEVKGTEGNEYTMFSISVARDFKKPDEQYYPEDLITCKAFKSTAKFLGTHFAKGSKLLIQGSLRRDDDYEKDGQMVKGQMYVNVEKVYFCDGGAKSEGAAPAKAAAPVLAAGAKKPGASPLAGAKKPGAKKPF